MQSSSLPSQVLNRLDIASVTQHLANKYYRQPYPNQPSKSINRFYHGALHATCTVFAAQLLVDFYRKYLPSQANAELCQYDTDLEFKTLMTYAVYCHDIGNTSENCNDQTPHARIFQREMTALGFPADKIRFFTDIILNKDQANASTIYHALIHDADALEYIRVLLPKQTYHGTLVAEAHDKSYKKFNKSYLHLYNNLEVTLSPAEFAKADQELCQIVKTYLHMTLLLYTNYFHKQCENAHNCYIRTEYYIQCIRKYIFLNIELDDHSILFPHNFQITASEYLPMLELYNSSVQEKTYLSTQTLLLGDKPNTMIYETSSADRFIRRHNPTKRNPMNCEISILETNARQMKHHEGKSPAELQALFMPGNNHSLLYRPVTAIYPNIPIETYFEANGCAFELQLSTDPFYIFKKNMCSDRLKRLKSPVNFTDRSFYARVKNIPSVAALKTKILETEERRCGRQIDNNASYFGKAKQDRSELYVHYVISDIRSIIASENVLAARSALSWRVMLYELTGMIYPLKRYSAMRGLESVSVDEVLFWAGCKPKHAPDFAPRLELPPTGPQEVLALTEVIDLACSLEEKDDKDTWPVRYTFTAELNNTSEKFIAQYENNVGVFTNLGTGKKYVDRDGQMRIIANNHLVQMVNRCNTLLDAMQSFLYRKGQVKNLYMALTKDDVRQKRILTVAYLPGESRPDPRTLVSLIGYDLDKYKTFEPLYSTHNQHQRLRLPATQAVYAIYKSLYTLKLQQSRSSIWLGTISLVPSLANPQDTLNLLSLVYYCVPNYFPVILTKARLGNSIDAVTDEVFSDLLNGYLHYNNSHSIDFFTDSLTRSPRKNFVGDIFASISIAITRKKYLLAQALYRSYAGILLQSRSLHKYQPVFHQVCDTGSVELILCFLNSPHSIGTINGNGVFPLSECKVLSEVLVKAIETDSYELDVYIKLLKHHFTEMTQPVFQAYVTLVLTHGGVIPDNVLAAKELNEQSWLFMQMQWQQLEFGSQLLATFVLQAIRARTLAPIDFILLDQSSLMDFNRYNERDCNDVVLFFLNKSFHNFMRLIEILAVKQNKKPFSDTIFAEIIAKLWYEKKYSALIIVLQNFSGQRLDVTSIFKDENKCLYQIIAGHPRSSDAMVEALLNVVDATPAYRNVLRHFKTTLQNINDACSGNLHHLNVDHVNAILDLLICQIRSKTINNAHTMYKMLATIKANFESSQLSSCQPKFDGILMVLQFKSDPAAQLLPVIEVLRPLAQQNMVLKLFVDLITQLHALEESAMAITDSQFRLCDTTLSRAERSLRQLQDYVKNYTDDTQSSLTERLDYMQLALVMAKCDSTSSPRCVVQRYFQEGITDILSSLIELIAGPLSEPVSVRHASNQHVFFSVFSSGFAQSAAEPSSPLSDEPASPLVSNLRRH